MEFQHKNIRRPAAHYVGHRWYFVTFCCANRHAIFANAPEAEWFTGELRGQSESHRFAIHAYCVMPDHVHLLAFGLDSASDLLLFLKSLKQSTGYEFKRRFRRDLWQKKFYDHILRSHDTPERVAAYIWMNPVRKGICADPREYPYSGSFVQDWKQIAPVKPWVAPWQMLTPRTEARPA
ncbi:MAG TPA: transposase [Candidatus Acidoferrales bacterium]|nr:transposase [Candidatus Acidoferrales bacterium]